MLIVDLIKDLEKYPPSEEVCQVLWVGEDVACRAGERNKTVTKEQIDRILQKMQHNHDAEYGISWDTIDQITDDVLEGE